MEHGLKLCKDHEGKKVNNTIYKQIVGRLMYLTTNGESKGDASPCRQKDFSLFTRNQGIWYFLQEIGNSKLGRLY